jgi:hypothetical protein
LISDAIELKDDSLIPERNIIMDTIIRHVVAHTKEEAIGMFIIGTSDIKCKSRIGVPTCFELDTLKIIV